MAETLLEDINHKATDALDQQDLDTKGRRFHIHELIK